MLSSVVIIVGTVAQTSQLRLQKKKEEHARLLALASLACWRWPAGPPSTRFVAGGGHKGTKVYSDILGWWRSAAKNDYVLGALRRGVAGVGAP